MTQDDQLLHRAAIRARLRPEYVGWILAQFGEHEGMDEGQVQDRIGVSAGDWPRLNLCLRPRAEQFLKDVTSISQEFGINRETFAAMVRKVDAMHRLRESQPSGDAGHLLAARSRKKKRVKPNDAQEDGHES